MTQIDYRPNLTPKEDSGQDPLIRDGRQRGRRNLHRWIAGVTTAAAGVGAAAVVFGGAPPAPVRNDTPTPPAPGNSQVDVPVVPEVPRGEAVPALATKDRLAEKCEIIEVPVGEPFGETCVFFTGGTTNSVVGPEQAGVEFVVEYAMKGTPNGDGTVTIPATSVPFSFTPAGGEPWANGDPWAKLSGDLEYASFEKSLPLGGKVYDSAGNRLSLIVPCGDGAENVAVTAKTQVFLNPADAMAGTNPSAEKVIEMGNFDLSAVCAAATANRGGIDQSTQAAAMGIDR